MLLLFLWRKKVEPRMRCDVYVVGLEEKEADLKKIKFLPPGAQKPAPCQLWEELTTLLKTSALVEVEQWC